MNRWFKIVRNLSYTIKYLVDPRVSFFKKAVILGALIYVLLPIDLLPDPVLGFGFIDDGFVLLFVLMRLLEQLDEYVKDKEGRNSYYYNNHGSEEDNMVVDDVEYEVYDEDDNGS